MKKLTVTNNPTLRRVFPMFSSVYEQRIEQSPLHRSRTWPSVEECAHLRMVQRADLVQCPGSEDFAGMQHNCLIGNHLDAGQFVGHNQNRYVKLRFQSQNQ